MEALCSKQMSHRLLLLAFISQYGMKQPVKTLGAFKNTQTSVGFFQKGISGIHCNYWYSFYVRKGGSACPRPFKAVQNI